MKTKDTFRAEILIGQYGIRTVLDKHFCYFCPPSCVCSNGFVSVVSVEIVQAPHSYFFFQFVSVEFT